MLDAFPLRQAERQLFTTNRADFIWRFWFSWSVASGFLLHQGWDVFARCGTANKGLDMPDYWKRQAQVRAKRLRKSNQKTIHIFDGQGWREHGVLSGFSQVIEVHQDGHESLLQACLPNKAAVTYSRTYNGITRICGSHSVVRSLPLARLTRDTLRKGK